MRPRWQRIMFFAPLGMLGLAVFIFAGGEIVRQLWNWLMPLLFGLRQITFWQAVGLLGLCRILFGGFRLSGSGSRSNFRRRMAERWEKMSPEERERYRQSWRGRCGSFEPPLEPKTNA